MKNVKHLIINVENRKRRRKMLKKKVQVHNLHEARKIYIKYKKVFLFRLDMMIMLCC